MINKTILEEKLNNTYKGIITTESDLPIQLNGYEIRNNKGGIYLGLYGPDNFVFTNEISTFELFFIQNHNKQF